MLVEIFTGPFYCFASMDLISLPRIISPYYYMIN